MFKKSTSERGQIAEAIAISLLLLLVVGLGVVGWAGSKDPYGGGPIATATSVPTIRPALTDVTAIPTTPPSSSVEVHWRLWGDLCGLPDTISVLYFVEKPVISATTESDVWYQFPGYYASTANAPTYWDLDVINQPRFFIVESRPAVSGKAYCSQFVLEQGTWIVTLNK